MDDLAEFKQTYFQECEELLIDLESQLTALQEGETDDEILHAAFRAIHSIKGGAGAFSFNDLVKFAHVFETVLDQMREHRLEASITNVNLLIRAGDVLSDLVVAAQNEDTLPSDFGQELLESLHHLAGTEINDDEGDDEDIFNDADFDSKDDQVASGEPKTSSDEGERRSVQIRFEPKQELFRRANDPLFLVRELKSLGTVETNVDISGLVELGDMEPDGAYLAWHFEVSTDASTAMIQEIFEFVIDDCSLTIEDPTTDTPPSVVISSTDLSHGDGTYETNAHPTPTLSQKNIIEKKTTKASKATLEKKAPASIRVDLERIDRLVNMVGELVITQAMLSEQVGRLPADQHASLLNGVETLALQMRELQESVMSIRAQPVKSVFSRMTRLVRELSGSLGKEAKLIITGENTEVDKTVIEELADPLTHMIRNSMDHGLELPDERERAGKLREGTIHLTAEHRSGKIVISVSDDGRGINREKVLEKAIQKSLISAESRPSDEEIDNLILLPGFSTAEQISDVSGRGVGMDVVVQKIKNMGGRIGITSVPGRSSKFSLTLPLTLAVLDGMIIRVGDENYIIPITSIVESLRPDDRDIHEIAGAGDVLSIRENYIRLIYLSHLFGTSTPATAVSDSLIVVVETGASSRVGFVVDELVGQQQVVIKSLESNYRRIQGIAGATILGNGMVAMILDVDGIRAMAQDELGYADHSLCSELIDA